MQSSTLWETLRYMLIAWFNHFPPTSLSNTSHNFFIWVHCQRPSANKFQFMPYFNYVLSVIRRISIQVYCCFWLKYIMPWIDATWCWSIYLKNVECLFLSVIAVDTNTTKTAMTGMVVVVAAFSVPCTIWMFYGDIKSYQFAIYISAEWFWNSYLLPYDRDRAGGRLLLQTDMASHLWRFNYNISCPVRCSFSSRNMSQTNTLRFNTRWWIVA